MSVVFVLGSEEQLSRGLPWCKAIADNMRTRIEIVVIGSDHKVLCEHARRRLATELDQPLDQVSVEGIDTDTDAILTHLRVTGCSTLAMVYDEPLEELQRELFEHSRQPAFWLQASGPPPASAGRLFAAMGQTNMATTTVSEKLFGFAPAAVLSDPFEQTDEPLGEVVARVTRQIETDATATGDLVLVGIGEPARANPIYTCLLYTSDAADDSKRV